MPHPTTVGSLLRLETIKWLLQVSHGPLLFACAPFYVQSCRCIRLIPLMHPITSNHVLRCAENGKGLVVPRHLLRLSEMALFLLVMELAHRCYKMCRRAFAPLQRLCMRLTDCAVWRRDRDGKAPRQLQNSLRLRRWYFNPVFSMVLLVLLSVQSPAEAATTSTESLQLVANTGTLGLLAVIASQIQYVIMHGLAIAQMPIEQPQQKPSASDELKIDPLMWETSGNVASTPDGSSQSHAAGDTPLTKGFENNAKEAQGYSPIAAWTRRVQEQPLCHDGTDMQAMLSLCCVNGGGRHRRVQSGCSSLPDQCSDACAPLFLAFYSSCPSLAEEIEGAEAFHGKCAAVGQSVPPPPPSPSPPPVQHQLTCEDSDLWVGSQGQRCGQYAIDAPSSWHATCNADEGTTAFNGTSTSVTAMVTAAAACPVACGTCPRCDDGQRNGDESGVDCGGSCPRLCDPNAACVPFEQSGLLGQNMHALCSGGTSAGSVCHTVAQPGFQTASIGSVAASCKADTNDVSRRECEAQFASMMVPPADVTPGRWRCVDGQWTGFAIAILPIVPTTCPTVLKANHYSGSCPTGGGPCNVIQAECSEGYMQVQGDGVFSCVNGRWLGHLLCVPTDCGATVDQQPVDASSFAPCTDGTTLGSTCDAQYQEGFYAEAGTGLATFTRTDEYGGTWLEQGSPWYPSSLVCTRYVLSNHTCTQSCCQNETGPASSPKHCHALIGALRSSTAMSLPARPEPMRFAQSASTATTHTDATRSQRDVFLCQLSLLQGLLMVLSGLILLGMQ